MTFRRALLPVLFAALLAGCGADAPGPVVMSEQELADWEIAVVEDRIDKNEAFMDPDRTPLRAEDLPGFEGLNYYKTLEPGLRYVVPLVEASGDEIVKLEKRRGEIVDYRLRGVAAFSYEGERYELSVFGPVDPRPGQDYLWLPFYDATNGAETYGGGRYLDLELDGAGNVEIDFNRAYNPLCDYDHERFNCTLPPAGNTLPFPVRVGEKLFALEE